MHSLATDSPDRRYTIAAVSLISVAVMVCYLPGISAPFVFDTQKILVNEGQFQEAEPIWVAATKNTRSLVNWTFAWNYRLGGLRPWWYRAANVAIHLLAALTMFGLVRRTLDQEGTKEPLRRNASSLALAVALIWAVHPLQTQAVTYVIQRYESLMALFFLLTLYCVLRGVQATALNVIWYLLAIAACWLGMHCKPVMAAAPPVVLLFDYAFLSTGWRDLLRRRWWLHIALFATLAVLLFRMRGALDPTHSGGGFSGFGVEAVGPWEYLRTQPQVILHYLRLAFWPDPLCLDYVWKIADNPWEIYLPGALILVFVGWGFYALLRWPKVGFLVLSFFLILAPTSSFVPIADIAFEHRMYLPLAPLVVLVVMVMWLLIRRIPAKRLDYRVAGGIMLALVVVGLAARTIFRNLDYTNAIRLWTSVVAAAPENSRAHDYLGIALARAGREKESEQHFLEAIKYQPQFPWPYLNYAVLLARQERWQEAEAQYKNVLQIQPHFAEAKRRYANFLVQRGKSERAHEMYRQASADDPENPRIWDEWGNLFFQQDDYAQAIDKYQRATKADPRHAPAQLHLGLASFENGNWATSQQALQAAIELQPDSFEAHLHAAWLWAAAPDDSLRDAERAINRATQLVQATNQQNAAALDVLAAAQAERGEFATAVQTAERAQRMAKSDGNDELSQQISGRIEGYRLHTPHRLSAKAPAAMRN